MIRRPPRSTLSSSSAASDVYKRQVPIYAAVNNAYGESGRRLGRAERGRDPLVDPAPQLWQLERAGMAADLLTVPEQQQRGDHARIVVRLRPARLLDVHLDELHASRTLRDDALEEWPDESAGLCPRGPQLHAHHDRAAVHDRRVVGVHRL